MTRRRRALAMTGTTRCHDPGWAGKAMIVTGGASGIGRALAGEMVGAGATVLVADRDRAGAEGAAAALGGTGTGSVLAAALDVRDREAFRELVDRFVADHGRIDVLVNAAGVSVGGAVERLGGAHWDLAIDVNLGGVVNGVIAVYGHMVSAGRGHIVNIASGVGLAPSPFVAPYAASKHGVVGLSLSLRPEAALHGITVSVVCPGAVETPILDRLPPDDLPPVDGPTVTARRYLEVLGQQPISLERFVAGVLPGLRRGRALIVVPRGTRALWRLHRLSPAAVQAVLGHLARRIDRQLLRPGRQASGWSIRANGTASSSRKATSRRVRSSPNAPWSWTPTGRPSAVRPRGREMPGAPVTFWMGV